MQIYFGPESIDAIEVTEGMLVSSSCDTKVFYYGVEYGSNIGGFDEVVVYDGVGRMVPIHIQAVPELIEALEQAYTVYRQLNFSESLRERVARFDTEDHVSI